MCWEVCVCVCVCVLRISSSSDKWPRESSASCDWRQIWARWRYVVYYFVMSPEIRVACIWIEICKNHSCDSYVEIFVVFCQMRAPNDYVPSTTFAAFVFNCMSAISELCPPYCIYRPIALHQWTYSPRFQDPLPGDEIRTALLKSEIVRYYLLLLPSFADSCTESSLFFFKPGKLSFWQLWNIDRHSPTSSEKSRPSLPNTSKTQHPHLPREGEGYRMHWRPNKTSRTN